MVNLETDVLIIGAGGAGMYAAIAAVKNDAKWHDFICSSLVKYGEITKNYWHDELSLKSYKNG